MVNACTHFSTGVRLRRGRVSSCVQAGSEDLRAAVHVIWATDAGSRVTETDLRKLEADDTPRDRIMEISVDGTSVLFEVWESSETRWAASFADHRIVLEARECPLEGLGLHRVHDLEPYLAGRASVIREMRGEL